MRLYCILSMTTVLKTITGLLLFFCVFACSNKAEEQPDEEQTENIETRKTAILTEKDIAKLDYVEFELDTKVEAIIVDWQSYYELTTAINNFKTSNFNFFENDDEAVKQLVKDLRKTIPDTLDTQAIQSRITIVESMLYKLKASYNLQNIEKEELGKTLKEVLVSYSNFNFQLNKKLEKDSQRIERP